MPELTLSNNGAHSASPFDAKRRTRPDGTEYWSARELGELLGYSLWQHFMPIVQKARAGAEATGLLVDMHFTHKRENPSGQGGRPREDFELSRLACYLVALAADESKDPVAKAKLYFAVKTREAEVAPVAFLIPKTLPEALRAYAAEVERRELAEAQVERAHAVVLHQGKQLEEAQPKVDAYDDLIDASGTYSLAGAAQALGMSRPRFIEALHKLNMIIVRPGHSDHLRPYEEHRRAGRLMVRVRSFQQEHRDGRITSETDTTTRVTPKGLTYIRQRLHRQDRLTGVS